MVLIHAVAVKCLISYLLESSCGSGCLFLCSFGFPCGSDADCNSQSCTANFCDIGSPGTLRLIPASSFKVIRPNGQAGTPSSVGTTSTSTSRPISTVTASSSSKRTTTTVITVARSTSTSSPNAVRTTSTSTSATTSRITSSSRITTTIRSSSIIRSTSTIRSTITSTRNVITITITRSSSSNRMSKTTTSTSKTGGISTVSSSRTTTSSTRTTTSSTRTTTSSIRTTTSSIRTTITGASQSSPPSSSFGAECLTQHNNRRAQCETLTGKSIAPLNWDNNLARDAKIWADTLASRNSFYHSSEKNWGHGENLYAVTLNGNLNCKPAVDAFFNEYKYYNNEPIGQGNLAAYGHFTQLAWPNSTQLGCAYADGSRWRYTVCEYSPAGNIAGRRLNVRVKGLSSY